MSLFVFVVHTVSTYNVLRGTGNLLCFDNKADLVTAVLSPPLPLCTEVFLFSPNQILSLTSVAVHDALSSET